MTATTPEIWQALIARSTGPGPDDWRSEFLPGTYTNSQAALDAAMAYMDATPGIRGAFAHWVNRPEAGRREGCGK